jgi:hypothetical protein
LRVISLNSKPCPECKVRHVLRSLSFCNILLRYRRRRARAATT